MTLFDLPEEPTPEVCSHGRTRTERCPSCLADARLGRDEGMARAEAHAPALWNAAAVRLLDELIAEGDTFTTDVFWARLGHPPEPRALGPIVARASRRGRITKVGYVQSTRPECHARPIPVWMPVR